MCLRSAPNPRRVVLLPVGTVARIMFIVMVTIRCWVSAMRENTSMRNQVHVMLPPMYNVFWTKSMNRPCRRKPMMKHPQKSLKSINNQRRQLCRHPVKWIYSMWRPLSSQIVRSVMIPARLYWFPAIPHALATICAITATPWRCTAPISCTSMRIRDNAITQRTCTVRWVSSGLYSINVCANLRSALAWGAVGAQVSTPHDGLLSASGEVQLLLLLHQGLPDAAAVSLSLRLGHGETQLRAPWCGQVLQQCETRVTGNVTMGLPRRQEPTNCCDRDLVFVLYL